jgi:hypothetical protein
MSTIGDGTSDEALSFALDEEREMVRFYFHLKDGDQLMTDEEGSDLPDLSAAKREAELAAREFLAEAIKAGRSQVPESFVIADDAGRELGTVALADVLPQRFRK